LPVISIAAAATGAVALVPLSRSLHRTTTTPALGLPAPPPTDGPVQTRWKNDHDPALGSDVSPAMLVILIFVWTILCHFTRPICRLAFRHPVQRGYYDVKEHPGVEGLVALTIDDALCRQSEEHSLIEEVQKVLYERSAKATFFCTLNFAKGEWRERQLAGLLADGNELANHLVDDRPYDKVSLEEFERDFDAADTWIRQMSVGSGQSTTRWFRPPCGMMSEAMLKVLIRRGARTVLTDCYANDCMIPNPRYISWGMSRSVTHGSIMIIHMPERGFREWNLEAIMRVLEMLKQRGLRAVTLSELDRAATSM